MTPTATLYICFGYINVSASLEASDVFPDAVIRNIVKNGSNPGPLYGEVSLIGKIVAC